MIKNDVVYFKFRPKSPDGVIVAMMIYVNIHSIDIYGRKVIYE